MAKQPIQQLRERLGECLASDRDALARRLAGAERNSQRAPDALEKVTQAIERSVQRRAARLASRPRPTFPADLPIAQRREEIAAAIRAHQVVVVCGDTGSGKSTQLPKICLDLGRGADGLIGHTQPRRIAARAVATRVAEELGQPLGRTVGFKVRFTDHTGPQTLVKLMTDGVLLAETQHDRLLLQYDTLIIDEAHERSLNIDFLLGYLRTILPRRPDLKVVVTSATIDPKRFSDHFRGAPIIEVAGRTHPVDVLYRPRDDHEDANPIDAVLRAVDEACSLGMGDILVFLPGEREIRDVAEELTHHHARGPGGTEVLPLYARLSAEEQQRIFKPHSGRRIVLATNVAETSLTVPGIRYVVDSGVARISRYSARSRLQGLPIEAISQASGAQRAGRCGRVGPGVCIRLYSEEDFNSRPAFTDPEILRSNLASVILQMKALRLGEVESFPFIEPPGQRMIRDGYETLEELGAIDDARALTAVGQSLSRLPIDPRIGRMILAGEREGSMAEVLVIAAALSVQDPRERPMDQRDAADAAHKRFHHEGSDFLTILNIWRADHAEADKRSNSQLRKWRKDNFLSHMRMREWRDIHQQLRSIITEMGHRPNKDAADEGAVHRAILAGLLGSVGKLDDNGEYAGSRGNRFVLFPGSALFGSKSRWVMAAEIVRTTRVYARTAARIRPEWIEQVGGRLLKKSWSDPRWDEKTQRVVASEKAALFGLEVYAGRAADYSAVDPALCRQLFIHHALVEGELRSDAPFMRHNRAVLEEAERVQAKARRFDLIADAARRFAFFDERLPAEVVSGRTFERWRAGAENTAPRVLFMALEDLLLPGAEEVTPERFPDRVQLGAHALRVEYTFAPGEAEDGVTVRAPIGAVERLSTALADWIVPGLVRGRVIDMVRSLPKERRRQLGPAPDVADEFLRTSPRRDRTLAETFAEFLSARLGVRVEPSIWNEPAPAEPGPPADAGHRPRFVVVDEKGRAVAEDREIDALRHKASSAVAETLRRDTSTPFHRSGLTDWTFDDLPPTVPTGAGLTAVPAIVDEGRAVGLALFPRPDSAARAHRRGLRRLFALRAGREIRAALQHGAPLDRMRLQFKGAALEGDVLDALTLLTADLAFLVDGADLRVKRQFEDRFERGFGRIVTAARDAAALTGAILEQLHRVRLALEKPHPPAWAMTVLDIRDQAAWLTHGPFLLLTPIDRLRHYPRYLRAAEMRLDKLRQGKAAAEERARQEVRPQWERALQILTQISAMQPDAAPEMPAFRWMVEELRVSLFAQELGTPSPVSVRRLNEEWARLIAP
ncbi:MAG: ATP-dependent RNA helicase HrpA [Phycisphaerales bacterium]|nr:ATP-dependent RNA helicase HrpA [Phycisphaerales bacterium]